MLFCVCLLCWCVGFIVLECLLCVWVVICCMLLSGLGFEVYVICALVCVECVCWLFLMCCVMMYGLCM